MRGLVTRGLLAAVVLVGSACVDAPSAATSAADENVLAASFDALSREASQQGDVERSQEFVWAALAVRGGVVPSKLTIRNGGTSESYDAMVHAVGWTSPTAEQRVGTHRTLLAWRRAGASLQTLMISSTADVAPVQSPLSMTPGTVINAPFAGAHVLYSVRGTESGTWAGVNGTVRMTPSGTTTACVPASGTKSQNGVSCGQLKYNVAFDVGIQGASLESRLPIAQNAVLRLIATEQLVNGAKLTLSCATPTSDKGC